jgi:hypothetical protein
VTPRERSDACFEFCKLKGLHQEIIRPEVESFHAVPQGIAGREDEDRNIVATQAQRAQHVDAALVGQSPVEQRELKVVQGVLERAFSVRAVAHPVDAVALIRKAADEAGADHRVVFGNQNAHRWRFIARIECRA